ncbi:hypothetical protein GSI_05126 [Ganoderma sinense ZZ0214-1]|uniref:Uncharacterized protein n=1 Tax=Ganoderma sinense ZZ0214-1 TaxID=1077348 RepID=A0A2G8SF65_9APHY|nr:hypothetical protein GSI_05126 [Ganoderma sinense ZZ0214-1]
MRANVASGRLECLAAETLNDVDTRNHTKKLLQFLYAFTRATAQCGFNPTATGLSDISCGRICTLTIAASHRTSFRRYPKASPSPALHDRGHTSLAILCGDRGRGGGGRTSESGPPLPRSLAEGHGPPDRERRLGLGLDPVPSSSQNWPEKPPQKVYDMAAKLTTHDAILRMLARALRTRVWLGDDYAGDQLLG